MRCRDFLGQRNGHVMECSITQPALERRFGHAQASNPNECFRKHRAESEMLATVTVQKAQARCSDYQAWGRVSPTFLASGESLAEALTLPTLRDPTCDRLLPPSSWLPCFTPREPPRFRRPR